MIITLLHSCSHFTPQPVFFSGLLRLSSSSQPNLPLYSTIMTMTATETTPPTSSNNRLTGSSFIQKMRARGLQAAQFTTPVRGQKPERLFLHMSETKWSCIRLSCFSSIVWYRTTGGWTCSLGWAVCTWNCSNKVYGTSEANWKCKLLYHNENEQIKEGNR